MGRIIKGESLFPLFIILGLADNIPMDSSPTLSDAFSIVQHWSLNFLWKIWKGIYHSIEATDIWNPAFWAEIWYNFHKMCVEFDIVRSDPRKLPESQTTYKASSASITTKPFLCGMSNPNRQLFVDHVDGGSDRRTQTMPSGTSWRNSRGRWYPTPDYQLPPSFW